ncbi:ABC transporter permease subunit [Streptomyces sp. NPDC087849]|uniref:ABC transporter permease subunit n=1 Tax=Streptomyces sp. NPDC087849 TaxID=3365808 RepID=UPI00381B98AD
MEPSITDAARGVGMKELQVLLQAELPSSAPLIISGIRSATLQMVAAATVAAYVALGGLGRLLVDGLASLDYAQMLSGAVLVAALALAVDGVLALVQRLVVSDGLTGRASRAGTASDTTETSPDGLPSPASARTALS